MKKIIILILLFNWITVMAYWPGRYFYDAKAKCIYGLEVDKVGQWGIKKVCMSKKEVNK